jgi:putative peptide zinc metalloprotease protein
MSTVAANTSALLPGIRQDLELLPGPVLEQVGRTWRIRDPARNRFFDIGPFEFAVISAWSENIGAIELAQRVSERTGTTITPEELKPLLQFLQENELLSPQRSEVRQFLRQRRASSRPGFWKRLLHNYLFFRVPLFNPERLLNVLATCTGWIYTRGMLILLVALALVDIHLLFQHWPELIAHVDYAFTVEGLLLVGLAGVFSKFFHEFGHALTARRLGVRVPAMGVAFVVMYPMLYTDTSDSWRLRCKHDRLAIASAGMIAEFSLALFATLLWAITPDGVVRSVLFSIAFIGWVIALGLNASPFFRFDGYYVLSDALDMPNLHDRSTALARARLRRWFLGLQEPDTEPYLSPRRKNWLTLFALTTWIYRLVIFVTLAFFVYQYFFKLLGIFLMVVELAWFVVRPFYNEFVALRQRWRELRPRWTLLLLASLLAGLASWVWILASSISSPALMTARNEYFIQVPSAGLLVQVGVQNRQIATAGSELAVIVSPEALLRRDTAVISRNALIEELQRTAANTQSRERIRAIESQLAGTRAAESLSAKESELLRLRAPGEGVVRDLLPDALPGRWVRTRELLMRVVTENDGVIHAYVDESSVHHLPLGARASFYPDDLNLPPVQGRVVEIDTVAARTLPSAILSAAHGGSVATVNSPAGELLFHEVRYRVRIEPDQQTPVPRVLRGTVYIEGDSLKALTVMPQRIARAIVRELGF